MKNLLITLAMIIAAYALFSYLNLNKTPQTSSVDLSTQGEAKVAVADTESSPSNSLISVAANNADVFFLEPGDGATVKSPVTIKFGASNIAITPAGENTENSGHHHLLLDLDTLPDLSAPLPATDNVIHFGKGQTETTIALEPGTHSLQLLLGNFLHIPHQQAVISKKITITVE